MKRIGTLKHTYEQGHVQTVEDDVLNVVRKIRQISPRITVYWNDYLGVFTLTETSLGGDEERLIFNTPSLDERVIDRLLQADQWRGREDPSHVLPEGEDFVSVVDADQQRIDAEKDAATRERAAELNEALDAYLELDGRGVRASVRVPRVL